MADLTRVDLGVLQRNPDGSPVTRERTCVCGKTFTQSILSERYLASLERTQNTGRVGKCLDAVARQVPGFWVPKHCPPCERKDLALEARRVEFNDIRPSRGAA